MTKQKFAIFANGWSEEYLKLVLTGIQTRAAEINADLYTFINYSSGSEADKENVGERSIFALPELTMFDGIILLSNTFSAACERQYLHEEIIKHHIPAVSLEYELEGLPCLCSDTYSGVYKLTEHLIKEHNVKNIVYVSGPVDNIESQLRQKAVQDVLATIGQQLKPENILVGEWSYYGSHRTTAKWITEYALPDAFVCANDEMALGVCSALNDVGYTVPENVIVTGCDCTDSSQKIYPMLSTVAREWSTLGYDGLNCVLSQINNEPVSGTKIYSSIPVLGESCGCKVTDHRIEQRRRSMINNFKSQKENTIYEWHLRNMDEVLANVTGVQSLKDQLGWNFAYNHSFEGDNFLICLVEDFIQDDHHADFTPYMDTYLHLKDGQYQPLSTFPRKNLLPKLDLNPQESNSFVFLPLHVEDDIYGYVVFINKLNIVFTQALYTWTKHVNHDLERVRQNIRMEELNKMLTEVSMTDALTGLKNRAGYDALAVPALQKYQREGKLGAMIFADINRMKLINDKYGHLQGDYAICTVAEAIKRTLPSNWIAVRFGGDEFIMVGECKTQEDAEELKNRLSVNLEKVKKERDLCFPLTASFGAVVMNPEENYSLEEYLRKSDEAMYIMKQKAHAQD